MKTAIKSTALFFILMVFLSCKQGTKEIEKELETIRSAPEFVGEWDNFQQHWLQNTDTEIHKVEVAKKHRHFHLSVMAEERDSTAFEVTISEGRNGKNFVEKIRLAKSDVGTDAIRIDGDTLFVKGMKHFENDIPYRFIRARTFDGWLQYPMEQYKDSIFSLRNLQIHDQGGMAEVNANGQDYTVELTQLVYGKRIKLMKIAIYDMPLDSVGINSTSISYAWTSPEAKRLGINLRKIISGWTLIEPGYVNSTTMNKEEEK